MARCKSSPEVLRTKCELANRLKEIRTEQYGERGGPELARRLNLPIRTWYNYETGVTVPSEVLLRFIELTNVEPQWLLSGDGARYRRSRPLPGDRDSESIPAGSVRDLLHQALSMLDHDTEGAPIPSVIFPREHGLELDRPTDQVLVRVEDPAPSEGESELASSSTHLMKREWLSGPKRFQCLRIRGDSMMPLLADGAVVGIAERPETPEALNGVLVAAKIDDQVLIRWLQIAGPVALLRAEDPEIEPQIVPINDPEQGNVPEVMHFRRVLWSCTPHLAPVS